jgi:hypothetical protein
MPCRRRVRVASHHCRLPNPMATGMDQLRFPGQIPIFGWCRCICRRYWLHNVINILLTHLRVPPFVPSTFPSLSPPVNAHQRQWPVCSLCATASTHIAVFPPLSLQLVGYYHYLE